jgi:Flp pilus assembly protein CpaB
MTKKQYIFALIVLALGGFLGSLARDLLVNKSVQAGATANQQLPPPKARYVYDARHFSETDLILELNKLGTMGWDLANIEAKELKQTRNQQTISTPGYVVILKREY